MSEQQLEHLLPDIVQRLRDALNPSLVYLFGSCLTGTVAPDSDVDLLVIVEHSDQSFFQRGALAYRALRGIGVPVDVQVYTKDEFDSRAALPVSFERTVRTKGRAIYESREH